MHKRLFRAPSPALVISLIALFVALGGTTYAAVNLPANSVGTAQLKNNAVTAAKINTRLAKAPTTVADNPRTSTDPCVGSKPQTGIFCGTSSSYWSGGVFAANHVRFWRDALGVVHVAGEARSSSAFTAGGGGTLFFLPPAYRPKEIVAVPVMTGQSAGATPGSGGMLVIYPAHFKIAAASGGVSLYSAGNSGTEVVIGDAQFRTG